MAQLPWGDSVNNKKMYQVPRGLDVEADVLQPLLDIEARTGLSDPRKVTMAQDLGIGIVGAERLEQLLHRLLLSLCTSVGRLAFLVETALVADANAVGIVVEGMGAHLSLGTQG